MSPLPALDLSGVLRSAQRLDPAAVPALAIAAAQTFGGSEVAVYLVDFGQQVLEPVTGGSNHLQLPQSESVGASVAGRAFLQGRAISTERPGGTRIWAPIMEGTEVTGVLGVTVPTADQAVVDACKDLAILVGYIIATHARLTDSYNRYRRRKEMSLAASMQWDLLPPLSVHVREVAAAGMLEPAYEVGGDCFDYAVNGRHFDVAIMDSMGHGERSAVTSSLAIGSYRHDRREGRSLHEMHRNLDNVIAAQFGGATFVTGQLVRLELDTGNLNWVNAGHPRPLLIRSGRTLGQLECRPAPPWGVGTSDVEVASEPLEPGDSVLFYTDGVVDGRGSGDVGFGIDRLADLVGQHASDQLPVTAIVRAVIGAVVEHREHRLRDDATILLVQWTGGRET